VKQCARSAGAVLLALAVVAVGACSSNTTAPGTTTTTTGTSTATTTNTYTGTITTNGEAIFTFSISSAGNVKATLNSLSGSTTIGFLLGGYNSTSGTCTAAVANSAAVQGAILSGSPSAPVTGCVSVYDPTGGLTDPVDFTVTVIHP